MAFIEDPVTGYAGSITRVKGYRPIEITLTFKDGSKAVPDSVGMPRIGTAFYIGPEVLTPTTKKVTVNSTNTGQTLSGSLNQTGQQQSSVIYTSYVTSQSPILNSVRGAAIRLFWHDPTEPIPSTGDVPISPDKINIDSKLGIVEIQETAPQSKTSVIAYYYVAITENTPKILQSQWETLVSTTKAGLVGFNTSVGLSQVYPVTRNRTDYLYGKEVELRKPNLDRSSPDYYPVFEYITLSDGSIKFAVPLHKYSDMPAKVEVKYKTLGIQPRLIIDMIRDSDSGISPELPPVILAVETLKG